MKNKWLLISIEIANRELFGKSLLIIEAINQGYKCIIASRQSFFKYFKYLPKGIFLCKSASRIDEIYIEYAIECGNEVVCLDEEGFVESSLDHLVRYRLTKKNISNIQKYFLWGKKQQDAFKIEYPNYQDIFINTGNPRVELWTNNFLDFYQNKLKEIKEKFGNYILIPTSFSPANHYYGSKNRIDMFSNIYGLKDNDLDRELDYVNFVKGLLDEYLLLIPEISKHFSNIKILIKVHPSEKTLTWKELEKINKNIIVCQNYTVSELIKGSSLVIQSESTTAVEAYLSKIPVISYIPSSLFKSHKDKLLKIPMLVSKLIHDKNKLFDCISNVLKNDLSSFQFQNKIEINNELGSWLSNMQISDENPSFKKIINEINKVNSIHESKSFKKIKFILDNINGYLLDILSLFGNIIIFKNFFPKTLNKKIKIRELGYGNIRLRLKIFIIYNLEKIFNFKIFKKKLDKLNYYSGYGKNKGKGMNQEYINSVIDDASRTLKTSKPKVEEILKNTFLIH